MRHAWVMKLKPGNEAIYKQKHDDIWPEMLALMEQGGTRNFSILRTGISSRRVSANLEIGTM